MNTLISDDALFRKALQLARSRADWRRSARAGGNCLHSRADCLRRARVDESGILGWAVLAELRCRAEALAGGRA